MGQLIELVFESATPTTAKLLLRDLIHASEGVRDIHVDGNDVQAGTPAEQLVSVTGSCATLRFAGFNIAKIGVVPNVALRLLKTGQDCFDLELNIDLDDVVDVLDLASGLHDLARDLAKCHSVSSYYAGLEPAADEDTRFFTGESAGPLIFTTG